MKSPRHTLVRARFARGFTLVELMVVIVIVGILATLALVGMKRWLTTSKSVEAMHVIQAIRGAQERYRAENLVYLDVSTSGTLYPTDSPGLTKYNWVQDGHADYPRWERLNVGVTTSVQHGYSVRAGRPNTSPVEPPGMTVNWPPASEIMEPWYVIYAQGDLNGDGVFGRYASASTSGEIVRVNDGE